MVPKDGLLPLSRGQLDIWLSHESGLAGTEWQLGLLGRIDGTVQPGLLLEAIRQRMHEAEPARAAFFEIDGQVFQKPIDYSDIELRFHDFRNSDDPVREVRQGASAIQRTPMSLSGRLAIFALFRTRVDEYYRFGMCHHISVSGDPVPPAKLGSLQDAVDCAIPQLFAAQVERIPEAAALTCGGRPGWWPD
jgi:glycopeptidolipid biosynthesis protein